MTPDTPARVLAWDGCRLVPQEALADRGVAVADSWLVDNGRVRALAAHQKRFARSCWRETGLPVDEVRQFLVAVTAQVPTRGRWFPRVECTASATRLVARLRPPPEVSWYSPTVSATPGENPSSRGRTWPCWLR